MATVDDIETALQAQTPAELHAHIPALAQVLARLSDGRLSPKEVRRRLADPALSAMPSGASCIARAARWLRLHRSR